MAAVPGAMDMCIYHIQRGQTCRCYPKPLKADNIWTKIDLLRILVFVKWAHSI